MLGLIQALSCSTDSHERLEKSQTSDPKPLCFLLDCPFFFTRQPALTSPSMGAPSQGTEQQKTHLKVGIEHSVPNPYSNSTAHHHSPGQGSQHGRDTRQTHMLPMHAGPGLKPAPVGLGEAEAAGEKWEQTHEHRCHCPNAAAARLASSLAYTSLRAGVPGCLFSTGRSTRFPPRGSPVPTQPKTAHITAAPQPYP